jgi:hypothetical protein
VNQYILCAAHTDPYILEQAYEQDEEGLEEQPLCPHCQIGEHWNCTCYDEENNAALNDEPTAAGEVTGYDNGPTFW